MSEGSDTAGLLERPGDAADRAGDPRRAWLGASPDTWAMLAIAGAVLVANLPSLLGFFDANPLDFRSGLGAVVTPGLLGGKPTIDPSNGFVSQAIGHLAALDILHLHWPWWNPYEATGMPLLGETESAAFFPPTLLTALANGQLYEHVLLELVAGLATFRLLRRLELTRTAAVSAGIAFALNGKFAWFADAGVNPLPFLPLVLLGLERAYAATVSGHPGGWRGLALAGALSIYAGFPEVAYIDTLMCVVWAGWRFGCLPGRRRRAFVAKVALGCAAGALLAAPMLVAMASSLTTAYLGVHASSQLANAHLTLSALPQLLLPYIYGPVNGDPHVSTWIGVGGYLSTGLLVLAAVGAVGATRRGLRLVLVGWTLLMFARMYGEPPLLGHVIGLLPGMAKIEFYRYATATLALSVIVLAALGLDDLARATARRTWLAWAGLATLAAVIAGALYARGIVHTLGAGRHHVAYLQSSVLWGGLIAGLMVAASALRPAHARARLLAGLVALDALVLFAVPQFSAPRATASDRAAVTYLQRHLGEERFYTLGGFGAPLAPNYGSYFHLASLGIDDFPPQRYADFVRARLDPAVAFVGFRSSTAPTPTAELLSHLDGYRLAAVGYILTARANRLPRNPALRLVFESPTVRIYALEGAAPFFAAAGCQVISHGDSRATLQCPRPALLVRHETSYAGWSAQADGHPVAIRQVDGLFQGVLVPAGRHQVTFSFAPPGMGWALVGLLGGCALAAIPTVRRRTVSCGARARRPGRAGQ